MIGPVSGTGRAMVASLQQAIQKGMPPDQAIQYVKSMATQGVAPLADLYSMMNQFQRLKQQQVKPPQTPPTIRDQLNMMDQMQQMQPQQGNVQQMQAGAPAPQAMDRGLGAIDAGRMEYPQFADGGIVSGVVALAGGGDTIHMADGPPPSIFETTGAPITSLSDVTEGDFLSPDEEQEFSKLLDLQRNVFSSPYSDPASLSLWKRNEGRYKELLAKREASKRKNITERSEAAAAAEAKRRGLSFTPTSTAPTTASTTGTGTPTTGRDRTPPTGMGGGSYLDRSKYDVETGKLKTAAQTEAGIPAMQRAQQMQKDLEAMGIGEASRKQGEYLTKREAEAAKDLANDKRMALAQAGFAMAEAASRRGRERTGFLGAAAIGGATGTKLYQAALKENRALKDSIQQNRFALDQANEMIKMGNYRDGVAQARQAKDNLANLNQALATNELGISKFVGEQKAADRRLGAQLGAQEKRYAQAANIAQNKLMQGVLEQAPYLIKGFNKMEPKDQIKAVQSLIAGLAGGTSAMTGLDAEILEEE